MLRKKDYENALMHYAAKMQARQGHSGEEMTAIAKAMPLRMMKDPYLFAQYADTNGLSLNDALCIVEWLIKIGDYLCDIDVSSDITYDESVECFERVRVNTILIHRVNFILDQCMVQVYDILERDGRLRFTVKKAVGEANKPWDRYLSVHYHATERSAWSTLQDHCRLAHVAVSPYLESVYDTIRDHMISLGYRDVETKARCVVALLMGKVAGHSFSHFFETTEKECGVNYKRCFSEDDMTLMTRRFSDVCSLVGVPVEKDEYGFWMMNGYDPEKSSRFRGAWNRFIEALRDDDLMDDAAKRAIDINPAVREEYSHILEEEEQKRLGEDIERLSGKFKIGKL